MKLFAVTPGGGWNALLHASVKGLRTMCGRIRTGHDRRNRRTWSTCGRCGASAYQGDDVSVTGDQVVHVACMPLTR